MTMHRVLVLIKGLGRGGAEQLLVNASRYLDRERFDYQFAHVLPHKDALVRDLADQGFTVTCLHGRGTWTPVSRLRALVRTERIDLVHAHSPVPAVAARLALPRAPAMVYTEHNVWARYRLPTRVANALTFGRNDHVFTVSDEVRRSLRPPRAGSVPVETLYHGPDPELLSNAAGADGVRAEFGVPVDAPLIGTIGNLKPHKGYPYLLQAATLVRRELPAARFLVVGTGPLEADLRRESRRLGLEDAVTFTGFRDDAPRLLRAFDVFAMASLHEGLSIALLEAMAMGTPAVVTRAGGLPEVIRDGTDGLLVDPGDPDALAAQILRVLRDEELGARLRTAGPVRARDFDIRGAVRRMEAVYEELLS